MSDGPRHLMPPERLERVRELERERKRARYHSDPAYRERVRAQSRAAAERRRERALQTYDALLAQKQRKWARLPANGPVSDGGAA